MTHPAFILIGRNPPPSLTSIFPKLANAHPATGATSLIVFERLPERVFCAGEVSFAVNGIVTTPNAVKLAEVEILIVAVLNDILGTLTVIPVGSAPIVSEEIFSEKVNVYAVVVQISDAGRVALLERTGGVVSAGSATTIFTF